MVLSASPAKAIVYMWSDSAGVAHYTNKEYDVPVRYKTKVRLLYPEAPDSGVVQSGAANGKGIPAVPPPATANQVAGPAGPPVIRSAAPVTQIISTPSNTQERRGRKHRERSADEDE